MSSIVDGPKLASAETLATENGELPPGSSLHSQQEDNHNLEDGDDAKQQPSSKCCGWWQFQGVPKAKGFSYVRYTTIIAIVSIYVKTHAAQI